MLDIESSKRPLRHPSSHPPRAPSHPSQPQPKTALGERTSRASRVGPSPEGRMQIRVPCRAAPPVLPSVTRLPHPFLVPSSIPPTSERDPKVQRPRRYQITIATFDFDLHHVRLSLFQTTSSSSDLTSEKESLTDKSSYEKKTPQQTPTFIGPSPRPRHYTLHLYFLFPFPFFFKMSAKRESLVLVSSWRFWMSWEPGVGVVIG